MSDTHICVICGENLIPEKENIVVDVFPTDEGPIQRIVHKECIDYIKESIKNSF